MRTMHLVLWMILAVSFVDSLTSTNVYVVPFSRINDKISDGSRQHPYKSIQQALDHVETNHPRRTTINLYPTYYFAQSIRFTEVHSHTHMITMNNQDADFYDELIIQDHSYQRLIQATISGGMPVTGWVQIGTNTYTASVQAPVYVNQLFLNNQRLVRTRVPTNFSDYLYYDSSLSDPNQARYGFQYQPGQFNFKSLDDATVIVYHSWTESHHYIDHLITSNNTVLFTNPSEHAIGADLLQGKKRFHIENVCEALVPNSFCFVNSTKLITLMTDGSYDPNKVQIIASLEEYVVVIAGQSINRTVDDIIIDNVAIQHSTWNLDRTKQADGQAAAFLESASLFIANATSIILSNVEVSHTGSYGVWIKEGTTNIDIINSLVTDTGAGGIRIGQMSGFAPTPTTSINILSNEISYGGNVFPSAVGLISHHASDVVIADNVVHHHRYTGISIGWQWGYAPSDTSNILVQGNYIHDTGRHILCDQGGIYTLGIQQGTVINNNVIKNVYSFAVYMWGIYLDEGSSNIVVSNNVVYNTGWASLFQHYGANNTIINNVFARASLIEPPHPDDPRPDGDIRVQLTENHTSWNYTRNIIYDTYQGFNHSAFRSDQPNPIVSFSNNVYFNTFGTPLLFGHQSQQMSFGDWQKTGQDNNSVIADPLFAGDVNQCDFFSVQANSPAVQLGFANITKLSKWTPGCETDSEIFDNQFYHW